MMHRPPPTAPGAHDAGIEYGEIAADIAADNMAAHIAAMADDMPPPPPAGRLAGQSSSLTSYQREQVEAIAREEAAATPTTQHDDAAQAEISEEKAARRAAMTAKIAEKYAAAKAASEAAVALANAQAAAAPVNRKMFARGAAVLYDNPKNGKLELAHVTELHRDPEGEIEYYTIETNNGDERQVDGERLSASSWSEPRVYDDEEPVQAPMIHVHPYAPPGPRIGMGHRNWLGKLNHHGPKLVFVPPLDLTVRGIGGNGKAMATMGYAKWNKMMGKK